MCVCVGEGGGGGNNMRQKATNVLQWNGTLGRFVLYISLIIWGGGLRPLRSVTGEAYSWPINVIWGVTFV